MTTPPVGGPAPEEPGATDVRDEPSRDPSPGRHADRGEPKPVVAKKHGSFWRELPFLIVIALVLALLIKTFLVQAFNIPSASMENTLQGGNPSGSGSSSSHPYDRVLVNKLAYDFRDPHRGEIVVFSRPPGWPNESTISAPSNPVSHLLHSVGSVIGLAPSTDSDFIKRVIGVGGDTVACKQDVLYVNGHRLVEPYLYPR